MKNKLTDLNNHLFAQLERLGDESLDGEKLEQEINRSKAIAGVADRVIHNASLVLKAQQAFHQGESQAHPMLSQDQK
ncbi:MAG: hypothetical protein Q8L20_11035 [Gammaproteobacteria bacterium]|nr:hypothetical protein [Gammaproteobacteria bacterium]